MKTADAHGRRHRQGDRQLVRRLSQRRRLRPDRSRVPDGVQRPDRGRAGRRWTTSRRAGTVSAWGDTYGNRVDRFLAGTAYLDGASAESGHGPRLLHADRRRRLGPPRHEPDPAVDVRLELRHRPTPGRATTSCPSPTSTATDGRDRLRRRWRSTTTAAGCGTTGNGHGDAMHVGDLIPSRAGLEVFKVDEDATKPGSWMARRQHRAGPLVAPPPAATTGVACPSDIWSGSPGAESWSAKDTTLRNTTGTVDRARARARRTSSPGGTPTPRGNCSTAPTSTSTEPAATPACSPASGVHSNNGTKSTPSLSGDLLGDWREEVVWPHDGQHGAAHLQHPDPDHPRFVHADARPAVPGRRRLAEHRLQPAAAHELRPGRLTSRRAAPAALLPGSASGAAGPTASRNEIDHA